MRWAPQIFTRKSSHFLFLQLFTLSALAIMLPGCARLALIAPEAEPQQALYLRGEFNDWFSDQDKFVTHETDHLVVNKMLSPGQYQFLISDRDGSCQASLGDQSRAAETTPRSVHSDAVLTLTPCSNSATWNTQDNSMTLVVPETATYHFTLRTDSQPPRLVIVKGKSES